MLKKYLKNQKGLTLIELLAVIVILGIIAAIAIPAIGNVISNAREDAVVADARQAAEAAKLYLASNPGTDKDTLDATDLVDYYSGGKIEVISVSVSGGKVTKITFKYKNVDYSATPAQLQNEATKLSDLTPTT